MVVHLFPFTLGRQGPVARGVAAGVQAIGDGLRSISMTHPMRVEAGPIADPDLLREGWTDLIGRSLESNGFLEPAFLLSAAQHFLPGERPLLLRVEALNSPGRQLGLFAFSQRRSRFGVLARVWCPPLVALGTPVLDAERAAEVMDTVRAWFAREHPHVQGLLFSNVEAEGPFAQVLQDAAAIQGLGLRHFNLHKRARLRGGAPDPMAAHGGKLKELRRQRRRLSDLGTLSYTSAKTRPQVRDALEQFLAIESAGWKGRAGTALLCDPGTATFVRTMTRELAGHGNCRIDTLALNGHPIAMGITLHSRDRSWLWKIAYDEAHAGLSPGAQFIRDFTLRQLEEGHILQTDSCAIPDHPMIDRLWPDRLAITDLAVAVSPAHQAGFARACDAEARRRALRAQVKRVYRASIGRIR